MANVWQRDVWKKFFSTLINEAKLYVKKINKYILIYRAYNIINISLGVKWVENDISVIYSSIWSKCFLYIVIYCRYISDMYRLTCRWKIFMYRIYGWYIDNIFWYIGYILIVDIFFIYQWHTFDILKIHFFYNHV